MQAEIATRPVVPLEVAPGSSEAVFYWNRSLARRSLFLVWGMDAVYTSSTISLSHHRLETKLNSLSYAARTMTLYYRAESQVDDLIVAFAPSRAIAGGGVVDRYSARAVMSLIGWHIQLKKVMLELMPKEGSQPRNCLP